VALISVSNYLNSGFLVDPILIPYDRSLFMTYAIFIQNYGPLIYDLVWTYLSYSNSMLLYNNICKPLCDPELCFFVTDVKSKSQVHGESNLL